LHLVIKIYNLTAFMYSIAITFARLVYAIGSLTITYLFGKHVAALTINREEEKRKKEKEERSTAVRSRAS